MQAFFSKIFRFFQSFFVFCQFRGFLALQGRFRTIRFAVQNSPYRRRKPIFSSGL